MTVLTAASVKDVSFSKIVSQKLKVILLVMKYNKNNNLQFPRRYLYTDSMGVVEPGSMNANEIFPRHLKCYAHANMDQSGVCHDFAISQLTGL